jgi:hypothetical protein
VKQVLAPSYSNLYATMDNEDMRKMLEATTQQIKNYLGFDFDKRRRERPY